MLWDQYRSHDGYVSDLSDENSCDEDSCDEDIIDDVEPPPFQGLPQEVQSLVVDHLDFRGIVHLKATCTDLRKFPTIKQERAALAQYEEDLWTAWESIESASKSHNFCRLGVMFDFRRSHDWPTWCDNEDSEIVMENLYVSAPADPPEGLFAQWMKLANAQGMSQFFATWVGAAAIGKFHCYNCLVLKDAGEFDLSQFGKSFWVYLDVNNWEHPNMKELPKVEHMKSNDNSPRTCIECCLNKEPILTNGSLGWLQTFRYDYHIRCSRCLQVDCIKELFNTFDVPLLDLPPNTDYQKIFANVYGQDNPICRRMLQGTLCRRCFAEEETQWFAYKKHLRQEIEARTKYLAWMDDRDHKLNDNAAPMVDHVGNWQ